MKPLVHRARKRDPDAVHSIDHQFGRRLTPRSLYLSAGDVIPEALVIQCSNQAGVVEGDQPVVRVAFINDDQAEFVAEGDEIPEGEPDLAEVLVATGKVSQLVRLSREQFSQEETAGQLAQSVARAITRRADLAFVRQAAPTPPALGPTTGLLKIAGVVSGAAVTRRALYVASKTG